MSAELVKDDMKHWKIMFIGYPATPYEGGKFYLDVVFGDDYPFKPPKVKFITKVFHPNVSGGAICLDILRDKWTPVYNPQKMMLSIISLMDEPNCDDPYNSEASSLYKRDRSAYNKKVKEYVEKHAR